MIAGLYASYHGPDGLRAIAERVHGHAVRLAASLRNGGVEVVHDAFFDTLTVRVPGRAAEVAAAARSRAINLREVDADTIGDRARRDDDGRDRRVGVRGLRRRGRRRGRATERRDPGRAAAHDRVPHAPGVPPVPLGAPDAALPAPARRPRPRARPHDDPARFVHDEAQRDRRDDPDHVAGVRAHPSVRADGAGPGLPPRLRRPRAVARGDHRLRRGVAAAERGVAGRVRGPARDPRATTSTAARPTATCA